MPHPGHPQLEVRDLSVRYGSGVRSAFALESISFQMDSGEAIGLAGVSGSGKSTLSRAILGMLPAASQVQGEILFDGRDLLKVSPGELRTIRGNQIALIHQEPALALNPVMRVGSQIEEVIRAHTSLGRAERARRLEELLSWVRLEDPRYLRAYPHELSGGERHRVVIAQALACDPSLVIADEPTAGLDAIVQAEILQLFQRLRDERKFSLLLISHDRQVLARLTQRVLRLSCGRIAGDGQAVLGRAPLIHSRNESEAEAESPIMELRGLRKQYSQRSWFTQPHHKKDALCGVDLSLRQGTTTALVGASGSGKSTLARCMAMLERPDAGSIAFRGADILTASRSELRRLRPHVQLVFQESAAALNPNFSAREAIEEPLVIRGDATGLRRLRVATLMRDVGLDPDAALKPVTDFSGGERQRIAIARALAAEPAVMIFDESTSGLDEETERQILALLARLQAQHKLTYLLISHDLHTVAAIADSIAVMHGGRIVEQGETSRLLAHPQDTYSRQLVDAHNFHEGFSQAVAQ